MEYLTPSSLAAIVLGLLGLLLLAAAWVDVRSHRIPNRLVFAGAALGLLLNSVLPEGYGFTSSLPGALGLWKALAGLGIGLAVMLPLYLLRAMGAGDVKLVAMVGAFLGPDATIGAVLLILISGGLLALIVTLRQGTLGRLTSNLRTMLTTAFFKAVLHETPTLDAAPVSAGKLPYGVAIAAGTALYVGLMHSGSFNFLRVGIFF